MVSGVSLFLVAVGAILAWAVRISIPGVDRYAMGIILMVVGVIGALSSLFFWNGPLSRSRRTIVRDDPVAGRPGPLPRAATRSSNAVIGSRVTISHTSRASCSAGSVSSSEHGSSRAWARSTFRSRGGADRSTSRPTPPATGGPPSMPGNES